MRVLWVTSIFPDPEAPGEAARQNELLRALATKHQIAILTTDLGVRLRALDEAKQLGLRVRVVPWRMRRHPRLRPFKLLALVMGAAPSLDAWMRSSSLQPLADALIEETREWPVDAVVVFGGELAPVIARTGTIATLVIGGLFSGDRGSASLAERVRSALEIRNDRRWSRANYARAKTVFSLSESDAGRLSRLIGREVQTLRGAADLEMTRASKPVDVQDEARDAAVLPAASVVVCTRERPDLLRTCLQSVAVAVTVAPGTDVVIVEQGAPSAQRICDEVGLAATVVTDDWRGASRARNFGLRAARGDVVLFTDDDCEVPRVWIADHQRALADDRVIASLGRVAGLSRDDDTQDPAALPARHRAGSPPWVIGHASNLAARTSALRAIGGFDERIGPGSGGTVAGEDADVIVRLLRRGTVVSGTGDPVRHVEWRTEAENEANLVAYEEGAGVWIGKALREDPRRTWSLLRERLDMQKVRGNSGHRRAFLRGLANGLRLSAWRAR